MNLLRRLLRRLGLRRPKIPDTDYGRLYSWFSVREVEDAEPLVGALFRRRFHTDTFPAEPRHFVAFARQADGSELTLGYVHYAHWQGCELCGGLVVDERHYRRLPAAARATINAVGGIAEQLLRQSFAALPDTTKAIWGRIGDRQSELVCRRVGFVSTEAEYIFVVWRSAEFSGSDKQDLVDQVAAIGPF